MFTALLVDDEEWALSGAVHTFPLEENGFEILLATVNSEEAAQMICQQHPDLVIADIRMPEISGLDLLRLAKQENNTCVFILLSGFTDFAYAQEAISLDAFAYLLKPLKIEQAKETIEKAAKHLRKLHGLSEEDLSRESKTYRDLIDYIKLHYREPLLQKDVCERFGLHPSHGSRLFSRFAQVSFSEYLLKLRMKDAKELLLAGTHSVEEIGLLCGYNDYFYFTKVYTKYYGISPSKVRKAGFHAKK